MEKTVDRESQQKLYVQIIEIIREKIALGEWAINSLIPTEDELCSMFDVSKATIRLAVGELVKEGLLTRQQGKGTFVTNQAYTNGILMKVLVSDEIYSDDIETHRVIIVAEKLTPPEDIASLLMTNSEVFYSKSKVVLGKEVTYYEELFVPLDNMIDIRLEDLAQGGSISFLNMKSAKRVHKITQTVSVREIPKDRANKIKIQPGVKAMIIERILYCSDRTPIALIRYTAVGKNFQFYNEFKRIK